MVDAAQVREHMEVRGADGAHVGTVDRVEGNRIKLTKSDPASGGQHRYIDLGMVDAIQGGAVWLSQNADEARSASNSAATFMGGGGEDRFGPDLFGQAGLECRESRIGFDGVVAGIGKVDGTSAFMRPGRADTTTTRDARKIASSMSWVTNKTVFRSRSQIPRSVSCISARV